MNNKMNYPKLEELKTGSKIITESIEYTVVKEYKFAVSDLATTIGLGFFGDNLIGVNGLKIMQILNPDGSTLWEREKDFPQDGDTVYVSFPTSDSMSIKMIHHADNSKYIERNLINKTESEAIFKSEIMLDGIKKRWVPEHGKECYIVIATPNKTWVTKTIFEHCPTDYYHLLIGAVFKTEQEAEANKDKVLRRFEFIKNNCKED